MESERSGTSPWVFVGIGCLAAIFIFVAAIGGVFYYGFRKIQELEETMENPAARAEAAQQMLVTERIPDGYHPVVAFSVPFLMETVVLSDRAPDADGRVEGFDERGFIYFKTLTLGEQEQELRDFFEGRTDDADLLDQTSVRVNARELLARGSTEEIGRTLRWVTYRGEIGTTGSAQLGEGITSMVMIECPDDERMRMGIWFGPDPDPDAEPEAIDLSGTVGDQGEIQRFFSGFDVCRR